MQVTRIGIDIAKRQFEVHGVDERGTVVVRKSLKREQVSEFLAQLPRCEIGMEACGGAHYWAREMVKLGHEVKLMSPRFVRPYVKSVKYHLKFPPPYHLKLPPQVIGPSWGSARGRSPIAAPRELPRWS